MLANVDKKGNIVRGKRRKDLHQENSLSKPRIWSPKLFCV